MTADIAARIPVISDCLKTIGLDGSLQAMDPDGLCLMEIDDFSVVAGQPWASLWPAESRELVALALRQAADGKVARFAADCPTAKGTMKSWEVSVVPIRDPDGSIVALQSLSQDVTRRERERREAALVSRELSHCIKNLFAVVDSLIHLSSRSEPGVRPFVDGFRERLRGLGRAISYIHPIDAGDVQAAPSTVQGLIAALIAPYERAGADIEVTGDDAALGREAVTSVAMVLNELATNAVKYGALKQTDGRLLISLARSEDRLTMVWREAGSAEMESSADSGFGTSLLDRTVRFQLAGTIERDWLPTGLVVRLSLPLQRLAEN
jgi:two-component sensor histidine kinase